MNYVNVYSGTVLLFCALSKKSVSQLLFSDWLLPSLAEATILHQCSQLIYFYAPLARKGAKID